MRCAWSGGFLYGLHEQGIIPRTLVATSGTAGSAVYFASGQMESIKRIWTEHLPGKRFINFLRPNRIIDIDFLIDDVFKTREPIHWKAVQSSKVQILCPVHETNSPNVRIFSNNDLEYEVLRAAKALPLLYGKNVEIDGCQYRDYSFNISDLCALIDSQTRKIVIDVRSRNRLLRLLGKSFMLPQAEKPTETHNLEIITPNVSGHILTSVKAILTKDFEEGRQFAHQYFKENAR